LLDTLSFYYGDLFENEGQEVLVTPTALKTATQITPPLGAPWYECSGGFPEGEIKVGYEPIASNDGVHRTFMEFDLSGVDGELRWAFLDVEVANGSSEEITVEVWKTEADVPNEPDCEILWSSVGEFYYETPGWVCTSEIGGTVLMTFSLEDAIAALQAAINQNGKFSIVLKREFEGGGSFAELSNMASDHRLRLAVIPGGGGPA